ncbi:hypothetical protein BJV82DRAFT_618292 [Fennellomyces sp. T-0311]|nr:hypothetical protein BJV82DRAFT_618292 [Fennellomyces sp. T-0311]
MSNTILAFAESPLQGNNYDDSSSLMIPEEYDHAFPPLAAIKEAPMSGEWEEVDYDDDTFSCNSAVWIGSRSYAEVATNAGVQHEPVTLMRQNKYAWSTMLHSDFSSSLSPGNKRRDGIDKEYHDDIYDLWYQSKLTGCRKYDISHNIANRKKESFQTAYRRIAHPHILAWKKNIQPMEYELAKAREYLQEINSIQDRLPKPVRPGEPILIKDKNGNLREQRSDKNSVRLWQQQCLKDLCKDQRVKQIITARFEELADSSTFIRRMVPKNYYDSEICYLAAIFRRAPHLPFWSVQYNYEHQIIPKLEEDYKIARERSLRAFIEALPLPKDKSLSSISRKKYVRSILLQE